jgi:hypothetical protein
MHDFKVLDLLCEHGYIETGKTLVFFDQQLCAARHHDLRSLQTTMASGVVF